MDWTAISALGELVSAIAVIISLLYLARQIRSSGESMRANTRDSAFRQLHEWTCSTSTSPTASYIFVKGNNDYDSLTDQERAQFLFIMFSMTKIFENIFLHYCDGLIEEEVWQRNHSMLVSYISQPGGKFYIENRLGAFDPRFQELLRNPKSKSAVTSAHTMMTRDKQTKTH